MPPLGCNANCKLWQTVFIRATSIKPLRRPKTTLGIAVGLLIGSLALFPLDWGEPLPKAEKPMLFVNIDMPEGAGFEQTDNMAKLIENKCAL